MFHGSPHLSRLLYVCLPVLLLAMPVAAAPAEPETRKPARQDAVSRVRTWVAPPVDVERLKQEDALEAGRKDIPQRVGYPMKTNLNTENAGTWLEGKDGGQLWQLDVRSKGALWVVVGFSWFDLQPGASLTVSDRTGNRILGPYTSKDIRSHGQLWFPPVHGDGVRIELHWPAELAEEQPRLRLGTVSHGYRVLEGFDLDPVDDAGKSNSNGPSGSCNTDVACDTAWADQSRSSVRILSGGFAFCSGALVNNTANDCTPYVLTASHCNVNPPSTTYQFNYECSLCGGGTTETGHSMTGSTRAARWASSDMDLLLLDDEVPAEFDAYYSGWSRATNPATRSTGIHHPRGDVKKITHNFNALIPGMTADGGWGATHWRVTEWEEGTTEPSSSGSPMYDQNKRIIGQLHGGFASCTAITWDEYGKFDVSWAGGGTQSTRLEPWLDPLSTGTVTLDGIDHTFCETPAPDLELGNVARDDQAGNGDGVVDPGELVLLSPELENVGTDQATGVRSVLSTMTPLVTMVVDSADWPDLAAASSAAPIVPFEVSLDPQFLCGGNIEFRLDTLSNEGNWISSFTVATGTMNGTEIALDDDIENGTGLWSTVPLIGENPFTLSTSRSHSPTTSWFVEDLGTLADSVLQLETLVDLAPGAVLTFQHYMASEASFDGGVLEYTVDGTTWNDAADLITIGGYNLFIDTGFDSPLGGRAAWTGNLNGWQMVTVDLASLAGMDVGIRWRFASDTFVAAEGWYIDDLRLVRGAFECAALPLTPPGEVSPALLGAEPFRIIASPGGFDLSWSPPVSGGPAQDYLLYSWPLGSGKRKALACAGDLGTGTTATMATLPDNSGFLVIGRNTAGEGDYGNDRSPGQNICP